MGSRIPASLSSVPLLASGQPATVNHPTDVDEELDSSKTDAEESADEKDSRIHLLI